jgi:ribosome biogenesis protein ERB1
MGSKLTDKKRKSAESDSESDDELGNGLFDGVLSQSEDEEDYLPSDGDDEDVDESESEGTEGSEDEDDEDEDDILSDDIPSDVDGEEEINKLVKQQGELEITEPGVDPKPKGDDGVEKNYRVERDANGGERYVYECVLQLGRVSAWLMLTRS